MDFGVRKVCAWVLAPTHSPSKIVTMSIKAVRALFADRSVTPDSFNKLPKNSNPNNTIEPGAMKAVMMKLTMGNNIFSILLTWREGFIRIRRSPEVVKSFIMGG